MWVGWTIGGLGVLLSFVYFMVSRKVKRIEYAYHSVPVILHSIDALEILYKDQPVKNPTINVLRLMSSGTEPIKADDFESSIIVEFQGVDNLLSVHITKTSPDNLSTSYSADTNKIALEPLLLNPGDHIGFQAISDGSPTDVRVRTRIAGVPKPKRVRAPQNPGRLRDKVIIQGSVTILTVGLILGVWTLSNPEVRLTAKFVFSFIFFFLGIFAVSSTESTFRMYRRWYG